MEGQEEGAGKMTASKVYNGMTLQEAERYIESNLVTAARVYVANGYFLKRIRDDHLYEEDGYQSFEEYIRGRYGKDKGWASKCIKVNSQLSVEGDSPYLDSRYKDYSTYQLVELAYMDEDQREQADPGKTVKQLQEMRHPKEIPYFELEGQLNLETDFPEIFPVSKTSVQETVFPVYEERTFDMNVSEFETDVQGQLQDRDGEPEISDLEESGQVVTSQPAKSGRCFYDSRILMDMINEEEHTLEIMQDYWKYSQPCTYKKHRMKLEAYKLYQEMNDKGDGNNDVCKAD